MFKDIVKKRRLELGLKQSDIAKRLNVSVTTVSDWETGKRTPSLEDMNDISAAYESTPAELAGWITVDCRQARSTVDDEHLEDMVQIDRSRRTDEHFEDMVQTELESDNKKTIEFVRLYRSLSGEKRALIDQMILALKDKQ